MKKNIKIVSITFTLTLSMVTSFLYLNSNKNELSCESIISEYNINDKLDYRVRLKLNSYKNHIYLDLVGFYKKEKINRQYTYEYIKTNNNYILREISLSKYLDDNFTNEDKVSFLASEQLEFSLDSNSTDDITIFNDNINPIAFCYKQ